VRIWNRVSEGICLSVNIIMNIMTIEEKIEASETRVFKAVFPNTTNHYDTLFGGTAMMMMDEVAFIAATRFSRQIMVTVSSDRIDFTKPIPAGTFVELVARVIHVGNTSMKVRVDIFTEQMYSEEREKSVTGEFSFVAIDENKKPVRVIR
jgi:uncharacterized protein (TIGR00369 family)